MCRGRSIGHIEPGHGAHGGPGTLHVDRNNTLVSEPEDIAKEPIGDNDVHLYESPGHHRDWIDCIKSRKEPVAPVEVGHRSCTACLLHQIAMKVDRHLYWDPKKEKFVKDKAADAMLSRPRRKKYDFVG